MGQRTIRSVKVHCFQDDRELLLHRADLCDCVRASEIVGTGEVFRGEVRSVGPSFQMVDYVLRPRVSSSDLRDTNSPH